MCEGQLKRIAPLRLGNTVQSMQFRLLLLGDPVRRDEHEDIKQEFCRTSPCCLPAGIPRALKARFPHGALPEAVLPALQCALLCVAGLLRCSIGAVEWEHARHRSFCRKSMPWQQFAALSVAANFREQWLRKLKQLEQRQHEQQQQQQHVAAVPDSAPRQPKTAKKGQTSLQLFRRDWMKQHTVLGERKNFVTKGELGCCSRRLQRIIRCPTQELRGRVGCLKGCGCNYATTEEHSPRHAARDAPNS